MFASFLRGLVIVIFRVGVKCTFSRKMVFYVYACNSASTQWILTHLVSFSLLIQLKNNMFLISYFDISKFSDKVVGKADKSINCFICT